MTDTLALPLGRAGTRIAVSPLAIAWAFALVACLALSFLAVARIENFHAGRLDLDIQGQVIWNTAHGRPFASTVLKENDNHLAEHLAFSLPLMAILYAIRPDARVLVIVQALALAGASLAVFLYARRRLRDPREALVIQAAFLLMPLLANVAFDDFHPVVLAVLPLSFAAYLLLSGRTAPGLALLALAVVAEEEAALAALGLGLLLAWQGARRLGAGVALGALLFLALAAFVVMPAFRLPGAREGGSNRTLAHFSQLRSDPSQALALARPERVLDAASWLVLPSGGVVFAGPAGLLPAGPTFAAVFFQDERLVKRYRDHWAAIMLPFLGFAAADGLRRLSGQRWTHLLALGLIVGGTGWAYVLRSPLPGGFDYDPGDFFNDGQSEVIRAALPFIPPDVPLQASATLVAYLNNRPQVYEFPLDEHYADGVAPRAADVHLIVMDLNDRLTQRALGLKGGNPMRDEPPPALMVPAHKIVLVQRQAPAPAMRADAAALFGDAIRLDGYDVAREGDGLALTLHWRSEHKVYFPYARTVELLDGSGAVLASAADMELLSVAPTDDWREGQRILDRVVLRPGAEARPAGPLHFRVDWQSVKRSGGPLDRLPLADGRRAWDSPPLDVPAR